MELALVVPILILLVTAVVELGIGFNHYLVLNNAVRVAARAAALQGGSSAAADEAAAGAAGGLPVTITTATHGGDVTVTGTVPYSIAIFGLRLASGDLESSTTVPVE